MEKYKGKDKMEPMQDDFTAKNKQLLDEVQQCHSCHLDFFLLSFKSLIWEQVV